MQLFVVFFLCFLDLIGLWRFSKSMFKIEPILTCWQCSTFVHRFVRSTCVFVFEFEMFWFVFTCIWFMHVLSYLYRHIFRLYVVLVCPRFASYNPSLTPKLIFCWLYELSDIGPKHHYVYKCFEVMASDRAGSKRSSKTNVHSTSVMRHGEKYLTFMFSVLRPRQQQLRLQPFLSQWQNIITFITFSELRTALRY